MRLDEDNAVFDIVDRSFGDLLVKMLCVILAADGVITLIKAKQGILLRTSRGI